MRLPDTTSRLYRAPAPSIERNKVETRRSANGLRSVLVTEPRTSRSSSDVASKQMPGRAAARTYERQSYRVAQPRESFDTTLVKSSLLSEVDRRLRRYDVNGFGTVFRNSPPSQSSVALSPRYGTGASVVSDDKPALPSGS